jgi:hypothetical protein
MITSEKQYQVTKKQAEKFRLALESVQNTPEGELHPLQRKAYLEAYASQYEELVEQLEAWEGQSK